LEDIVPEPYLGFQDIFSKESFDELPEQKQWDHAIELTPGAQTFSMKMYPMSQVEQKELDDFLNENMSTGHIYPSKSLMASPVFFSRKRMGSCNLSKTTGN